MSKGAGQRMKLVIFDLDGTLIDSKKDLALATNHTLVLLGRDPLPESLIYGYVGDGVRRLLEQCLGETTPGLLDEAWEHFCTYYQQHLLDHTRLFPGVREVLESLIEQEMVIISNKPHRFCLPLLKGLGIYSFFRIILGGDSLDRKKPDPAPIYYALERLGLPPEEALIVGDSTTDIECGRRAGILTCAVTYGFRSREELTEAEPDFLIDHPKDLLPILSI